jgi:hypothetical protein
MEKVKDFIYQLNPTYVGIAASVLLVITVVLLTIWLTSLSRSEQLKKGYSQLVDKAKREMITNMRVSKLKAFNYDELKLYISRSGLGYMTDGKITPLEYMGLRIFFAVFFFIVGFRVNGFITAIAAAVFGYFVIDIITNASNSSDNTNMLDDIKSVYDTLRIQTKAGVYITSVITDCYLVVQNKRLKKALLELTGDIVAKSDVESSLDDFRNKFDNSYIDTLVIIVKQSLKTGQSAKMFDDIKIQIVDIENAMMLAEQLRIKRQITIVQILLYIAIIVVAIYIAMMALNSGLLF